MSGFDPGEGWRQVRADEYPETGLIRWTPDDPNEPEAYWVREAPLPPLPTEPYTVIRVTFDTEYVLLPGGEWLDVALGIRYTSEKFARITGFDVLAEPRAVTAKTVLGRVRKRVLGDTSWSRTGMDEVAREFGVDS